MLKIPVTPLLSAQEPSELEGRLAKRVRAAVLQLHIGERRQGRRADVNCVALAYAAVRAATERGVLLHERAGQLGGAKQACVVKLVGGARQKVRGAGVPRVVVSGLVTARHSIHLVAKRAVGVLVLDQVASRASHRRLERVRGGGLARVALRIALVASYGKTTEAALAKALVRGRMQLTGERAEHLVRVDAQDQDERSERDVALVGFELE